MTRKDDYTIVLNKLLSQNRPFAAWSMPGESVPELLICNPEDLLILPDFKKLNGQEGFVFAPYRITEKSPLILLRPGIRLKDRRSVLSFDIESLPVCEPSGQEEHDYYAIPEADYLRDIESAIAEIKHTSLSKVIISRLLAADRKDESVGELYMQLRTMTPNAFVYLVNLPQAGLWMGATPEALLQTHGKMMETVSLAGTQPRKAGTEYSWYTKEIEEQAFVSRYMLDVFYRFGIHPYSTRGPETMESGRVAHLKTSFRFAAQKIDHQLGNFIAELHPTPAVCGLPKDKADRFIEKTEKHDRRYYTGYLGPWRLNNCVRLFVNLRCMEITANHYILYSGGGITARSIPADEWIETNNKARTLLSAIEAVQTK
ncbi:MAG: chorismate-binding protein [Mangrovibacterium sp.]